MGSVTLKVHYKNWKYYYSCHVNLSDSSIIPNHLRAWGFLLFNSRVNVDYKRLDVLFSHAYDTESLPNKSTQTSNGILRVHKHSISLYPANNTFLCCVLNYLFHKHTYVNILMFHIPRGSNQPPCLYSGAYFILKICGGLKRPCEHVVHWVYSIFIAISISL